ncbi:hypothetical protein L6164_006405 [Bauhinia variegata]|uniref:Uncharacterized protein n=1 Tax=Bauhinia variegata TaxID=167791 RepID=A0ACB9PTJ5_BAUVA|nr:hypothetical protein L6164_006405 [Bauhinia variegata]
MRTVNISSLFSLSLQLLLSVSITANFAASCIDSERVALLRFKQHLNDSSNRLASWSEDGECCNWDGVVCSNLTGHVQELHLGSPTSKTGALLGGKVDANSLLNLTQLSYLDLGNNDFGGSKIPNFLGYMRSLRYLNLFNSGFQGKIPDQLGNLSNLEFLNLHGNGYVENLRWLSGNFKLRYLDLSGVNLNKSHDWIHVLNTLPFLKNLYLSSCQLHSVPSLPLVNLSSLAILDLSYNQLTGTIPECLGNLSNLEELRIGNNLMDGNVSDFHFAKLRDLKIFHAPENSLVLKVSPKWVPPFQISALALRNWHLGPHFPSWLHTQKQLRYLDISNTSISDIFPTWFWSVTSQIYYLNLSRNQIRGPVPDALTNADYHAVYDLSYNQFQGPLPHFSSNLTALDLSFNSFSGSLRRFLCNKTNDLQNMEVLNLGKNLLSGEIPECWEKWQKLVAIKLCDNNFTGSIPKSFGTLANLQSLHLRNNNVSGKIPSSIAKCTELLTVDFGGNKLTGVIPSWIGERLSKLIILSLHTNGLHGSIPNQICSLPSLQILDLSHNNLSGAIPSCIDNVRAMASTNKSDQNIFYNTCRGRFMEEIILVMKGRVLNYSTTLKLVKTMDLSDNRLSGEIPQEVTSLSGLQSLNLSHNRLIGRIPSNIGAVKSLESFDLSDNQICCDIPTSMSIMTFINHLNLSNNKLVGKIPTGTQIQSMDASCFSGNKLCGPPLSESCEENDGFRIIRDKEEAICTERNEVNWFYVSLALGFVVGFGTVTNYMLFRNY